MSIKRRNSSSVEPDEPPSKKQSVNRLSTYSPPDRHDERPRVDVDTGQSGAFPGLDNEDELFYGPALDGIDYLRMVRSERKGIPNLLTTIRSPEQDESTEGGHYHDGAYTAAPEHTTTSNSFTLAQKYYYDALLAHFRLIRATLRCIPPVEKIQELDGQQPISFPASSKAARNTWELQILERHPNPVQLACMQRESILQLLQLVTRKMMQLFKPNRLEHLDRVGAWIWAAMGSIPDRGELSSDEVAELRAFAERAIKVASWVESNQPYSSTSENVDSSGEEDDPVDGNAIDAMLVKSDQINSAQDVILETDQGGVEPADILAECTKRKMMVLDAIVTVVGEVYGQRDLLSSREPWKNTADLK